MPFLRYIIRKTLSFLSNTDDPQKGGALIGFLQTISGAVPKTVHGKLTEMVSVKDFGAVGDGATPDQDAIQAAIDSLGDEGGTLFFPAGKYEVKCGIVINKIRISLRGAGRHNTHIRFQPTQDNQTLFKFDAGPGNVLWQCKIRDMALVSSFDSDLTKTAIELKDTSNMIVKDLIIGPWTGNGNSIGLLVRGRERGQFNNLHIFRNEDYGKNHCLY